MRPLTVQSLSIAMLLAVSGSYSTAFAQTHHEIVRGRVATDSGRAVAGAQIVVTRIVDNASKSTSTDTAGAFSVDWPDGRGRST